MAFHPRPAPGAIMRGIAPHLRKPLTEFRCVNSHLPTQRPKSPWRSTRRPPGGSRPTPRSAGARWRAKRSAASCANSTRSTPPSPSRNSPQQTSTASTARRRNVSAAKFERLDGPPPPALVGTLIVAPGLALGRGEKVIRKAMALAGLATVLFLVVGGG